MSKSFSVHDGFTESDAGAADAPAVEVAEVSGTAADPHAELAAEAPVIVPAEGA